MIFVPYFIQAMADQAPPRDINIVMEVEAACDDEKVLDQDDVIKIVEELLDIQAQSVFLARLLKLPSHIIEEIKQYSDTKERLYNTVVEFVKQVDPKPTWRVIATALRNRVINQPRLAKHIEMKYCSNPPTQGCSNLLVMY